MAYAVGNPLKDEAESTGMSQQTPGAAATAQTDKARSKAISMKAAYFKSTSIKLAETTVKLEGIIATIGHSIATGRLDAREQLKLAQQAAELNLVTVQAQLLRLRKSGENDWEDSRKKVDDSWEHLSRSIRNLADRFSDGIR